ncbi:twin-arginine translocase TatA/TatE family subunit [Myxococcota bacterium]
MLTTGGMGSLSIVHWLVVIVVLLLLFGPRRFADAAKGLGQALRGFREELGRGSDEQAGRESDESKHLTGGESTGASGEQEKKG